MPTFNSIEKAYSMFTEVTYDLNHTNNKQKIMKFHHNIINY